MRTEVLAFLVAAQWWNQVQFRADLAAGPIMQTEEPSVSRPASTDCCPRVRGGCRSDEVRIVIDGVPVMDPLGLERPAPNGTSGVSESSLTMRLHGLWLVVIPADHFQREMVFDGEWIESRPRLRGPR